MLATIAGCNFKHQPLAGNVAAPNVTSRISGSGPTDIVLMPGLAGGNVAWRETVKHLQSTHRVHEIRVAGLAGNPGEGPRSVGALTQELASYLRAHTDVPATVVGHSAGGVAALQLAMEYPDLVRGIVIVDALPFMSANMGSAKVDEDLRGVAGRKVVEIESEPQGAFVERMQSQANEAVSSRSAAQQIAADSAQSNRSTYAALFGDVMTLDLRPRMAGISVPVTVIFADQAPHGAPPGHMKRRYQEQYKGIQARYVEIQNARHYVMLDQPAEFLSALDMAIN
jgi:pimeloyl-[acyl-carrier protein] methyl ester esterase